MERAVGKLHDIDSQEDDEAEFKDAGETSTRITQNLGWKLLMAAIDAISDMYKNGRKPMPAGYFGRDDL